MRPLELLVGVLCFLSLLIHVACCVHMRVCIACMYCLYVYMCACWGLGHITGWTWEHGAAAVSTLLGYQIWQILTISSLALLVLAIYSSHYHRLTGSFVQQQQR